jgi:hypothetical protein
MGNKTPKLRALAFREVKLARPSKVNHKKASAALSTLSRTLETSVDELQGQADLLHVEAVLVSEGLNDNDDGFLRDELKRAISTPILKPINWQHRDEKILGAMYAVEARDLDGNALTADEINDQPIELVIQGVVWHHLPHIKSTAEEIVSRIEKGDLFVSMECWFDDYDYGFYTQSGELFDRIARKPETAFLERHLRANGGTGKYSGMRIGRALSGVSFGGVAFVDRPANKRSLILNHFAFDPLAEVELVEAKSDGLGQDQVVTQTTLFSNESTTEVNMNDLNRAAASKDDIAQGVAEALEARDRAEAAKRTEADLQSAQARKVALENELAEAKSALEQIRAAVDTAYAGATQDTPEEIARIDRALDVKDGAGDAVWAAKIAWIADSRKAVANALVENKDVEADTNLIEENTALKAELNSIKQDLRTREIEYLFAELLGLEDDEVDKFVKAGLAKATDELYNEWLDEKKLFAKKMLELKNKKDKDKKEESKAAEDAEAGLLSPSDRETSIDDRGAVLRPRNGRAPADMPRVPRSRLAASADLEALFEEVNEPNLAGASADEGSNGESPMGQLVASLLDNKKGKED